MPRATSGRSDSSSSSSGGGGGGSSSSDVSDDGSSRPDVSRNKQQGNSNSAQAQQQQQAQPTQQQQQQQQQKRKKRGRAEYDDDQKLVHQAGKAAAREAKAVKAFMMQKAVRRRKEAKNIEKAAREIEDLKALPADAVTMRCLRSLGLAHTGQQNKEAEAERLGPRGVALVEKMMQHPRMTAVLKELEARATHRRKTKLALEEGRRPPRPLKKGAKQQDQLKPREGRKGVPLGSAIHMGDGAVFVASLSGELPDGEAAPLLRAAASRPTRRQRREGGTGDRASHGGGEVGDGSGRGMRKGGAGGGGGRADRRGGSGGDGAAPGGKRVGGKAVRGGGAQQNGGGAPAQQERGGAGGGDGGGGGGGANLHGSWVARRQQKAKEAAALTAFAGKRTTFDDSD